MVNNEVFFMDNWNDFSTTHFTHDSGIDCCNSCRRVYNGNTILGLVDSSFDIASYPYRKTN